MITLSNALTRVAEAGEPLPPVWPELENEAVNFRQGTLSVVAAGPGGNKSVFALNLAIRSGCCCLYISADADSFITSTRAASLLTGDPLAIVDTAIRNGVGAKYENVLNTLSRNVQWTFEPSPSIDDIRDEVEAFGHVYGRFPQLVVIDNLANVFSEEEDNTALRHNIEALNILARESGAAVVCLHHTVGEYESGDKPPALGSLIGKVGKMPSLVLTLFRSRYGDIGVCVVKNRFGPADPRGNMRIYLRANLERMRVG